MAGYFSQPFHNLQRRNLFSQNVQTFFSKIDRLRRVIDAIISFTFTIRFFGRRLGSRSSCFTLNKSFIARLDVTYLTCLYWIIKSPVSANLDIRSTWNTPKQIIASLQWEKSSSLNWLAFLLESIDVILALIAY